MIIWMRGAAVLLAGLALVGLVALLGACDRKGSPCQHAGDIRGENGHVYTCKRTEGGLVWASDLVPGTGVHTLPVPGPAGGVR
jgi:hypothetical protein